MNFNPRSREGSDRAASSNKEKRYQISIHAPARGATAQKIISYNSYIISIHAPARGATQHEAVSFLLSGYFNPRSREGSDFNFI